MKKAPTMSLQGKDYAKVADRMRLFREDNAKATVETSFQQLQDGQMVLRAIITKDDGASSTGQAMGKLSGAKAFEKLESIAVGRALAFLGYMASGEIASSEEMEEFIEYQNSKKEDAEVLLRQCENFEDLKKTFLSLGRGLMADNDLIDLKDELKTKLQ